MIPDHKRFITLSKLTKMYITVQQIVTLQLKYLNQPMDLQWLLPQQIDQILQFCQLSAVEDLTLAASILQGHNWNIQNALNDVVKQSQAVAKQGQSAAKKEDFKATTVQGSQYISQLFDPNSPTYRQYPIQNKHSSKEQHSQNSSLLKQQNFEYEQMGRKMKLKQEQEAKSEKERALKVMEFVQGQNWFKDRKTAGDFAIKFRLQCGTAHFSFSKEDTVETVMKYVNCCLRDNFENRWSEFELLQAHPIKSLTSRTAETLSQIFDDSTEEVLIVKELD